MTATWPRTRPAEALSWTARSVNFRSDVNTYRDFDEGHLDRGDVASARWLGIELALLRRLLCLADTRTCIDVKAIFLPQLAKQITTLKRRLRAVNDMQQQLREVQSHGDNCPGSIERSRSQRAF